MSRKESVLDTLVNEHLFNMSMPYLNVGEVGSTTLCLYVQSW